MFFLKRLAISFREAWKLTVRPVRGGKRVVMVHPDYAGLRGHIFNPFPSPDGRWLVQIDDPYDLERWPAYDSGWVDAFRWDFVIVDHGVKSWDQLRMEETQAEIARWHESEAA